MLTFWPHIISELGGVLYLIVERSKHFLHFVHDYYFVQSLCNKIMRGALCYSGLRGKNSCSKRGKVDFNKFFVHFNISFWTHPKLLMDHNADIDLQIK